MKPGQKIALLVVAVVFAACGSKTPATSGSGDGPSAPSTFSAEVATYDLVAGVPERVSIGIFSSDGLVSYGSIPVTFAYAGTEAKPQDPPTGAFDTTAHFVLVPQEVGHSHEGQGSTTRADTADAEASPSLYTDEELAAAAERDPEVTEPTEAKGVYQATDVVFDQPGFWKLTTTVTLADGSSASAEATFEVVAKPAYPAIGSKAPATVNNTTSDIGPNVTAASVDSRAVETGKIPDPDLHGVAISEALAAGQPIVVVVSTPTYCQSRFCGPITDEVSALQQQYGDKAQFVHLELWQNYQKHAINKAAAEWVYRDKNVTEPWVFLVGADGKIIDRWPNVMDPRELAAELEQLPSMGV